jgi:hypothetical protein
MSVRMNAIPNYATDTVRYVPASEAILPVLFPRPPRRISGRTRGPDRAARNLDPKIPTMPIRKGIPLPAKSIVQAAKYEKRVAYPWRRMAIGDSFVFPARSTITQTQRTATSAVSWRHSLRPERYAVRTTEDEKGITYVGIWRVA